MRSAYFSVDAWIFAFPNPEPDRRGLRMAAPTQYPSARHRVERQLSPPGPGNPRSFPEKPCRRPQVSVGGTGTPHVVTSNGRQAAQYSESCNCDAASMDFVRSAICRAIVSWTWPRSGVSRTSALRGFLRGVSIDGPATRDALRSVLTTARADCATGRHLVGEAGVPV